LKRPDFIFDARQIRKRLPRPKDLMMALVDIQTRGELDAIAQSWFDLRQPNSDEGVVSGDFIRQVIDRLVEPLPPNPQII